MYKVALTGVIGVGKSTSGAILKCHGITVISTDDLAKKALTPKTSSYKKLLSLLGPEYLQKNKYFDRTLVSKTIFKQKSLLSQFETVIHPAIIRLMKIEEKKALKKKESFIFYEVPLLFEKNLEKLFDITITIAVPPTKQLQRLRQYRNWDKSMIEARMQYHINQKDKIKKADYVIWNNSSVKNLESKLLKCIKQLKLNSQRKLFSC